MLELTLLEHHLVDHQNTNDCLAFEQYKRFSIAVEFIAYPSNIFLEEATRGLDSSGTNIVISCFKEDFEKLIHLLSISIFNTLVAPILMKAEIVTYIGDIGHESVLVKYFQHFPE